MKYLTLFHDTDAPVEVGRETIVQIVFDCAVTTGKESLMTDQQYLHGNFSM